MSYRLINANAIAEKYPEVNDLPCIYADIPNGLDDRHYTVIPVEDQIRNATKEFISNGLGINLSRVNDIKIDMRNKDGQIKNISIEFIPNENLED